MVVETASGAKTIDLKLGIDGKVSYATVDMGEPILTPAKIPVNVQAAKEAVDISLRTGRNMFKMTCVSMGNPHAVIYVDNVDSVPLELWGKEIETHPLFPDRVNVHFVQVISDGEVKMVTWERGSGMTLACGTGASAVCVAGVLSGKSGRSIIAHLPGGDLELSWNADDGHVFMTGPAVDVFTGEWPDDE